MNDLPLNLTPRQKKVLTLICQGKSREAIAEYLQISEKTCHYHTGNLTKQFGVKELYQVVALAYQHNIIKAG
ncbi:response regulator transcription factor [Gloeothece verrucosa]|uniref:Transcriptional regulator, LuxR family n=1 Tax=Gloeothece verrucosa (strain PCC 7822) TaxID=497965 RepID=E0UM90_GLOV7|nr:helix-turn-helix domain-containing protein [Gloeothece verrucosa]ADN18070.1 transcriptional regulator, LuxR family [Gloeothece verrucosa PCC 7822]